MLQGACYNMRQKGVFTLKRKFQLVSVLLASLMLLAALCLPFQKVSADKVKISPMFTYGESLTQSQYDETKRTLGVQDGTKEIKVYINELNGLLNDNYPYHQVYSSTYITPASNNGGVTVEIVTPKTITAISPRQYENAALTAGAVDVNIRVASAVTVDGSGALAGVYKAFKDAGYALDAEKVGVAQEELNLTSELTQENKDKAGYSDDAMNAAIAEIKNEIQKTKDENNGAINADQIQVIINNIINNYNLGDVLSEDNKQQIQNFMVQFSQIELTDEQKQALSDFGQKLLKSGDEIVQKAKSAWNNLDDSKKQEITQEATSLWQQILNFIKKLFNTFSN